jgi:hypothetical protein
MYAIIVQFLGYYVCDPRTSCCILGIRYTIIEPVFAAKLAYILSDRFPARTADDISYKQYSQVPDPPSIIICA